MFTLFNIFVISGDFGTFGLWNLARTIPTRHFRDLSRLNSGEIRVEKSAVLRSLVHTIGRSSNFEGRLSLKSFGGCGSWSSSQSAILFIHVNKLNETLLNNDFIARLFWLSHDFQSNTLIYILMKWNNNGFYYDKINMVIEI